MSVAIINPFNQLIQYTNGFCLKKDFSKEFLKCLHKFILNNNHDTNNITNSEILNTKLESLVLNRFEIPLMDIANENINLFLIDIFTIFNLYKEKEINNKSGLENHFIEFVKKELKITPYVSEKFIPFLLNLNQHFELKLVFESKLDKSVFNFLLCLLDPDIIKSFNNGINGKNY